LPAHVCLLTEFARGFVSYVWGIPCSDRSIYSNPFE
jgi:hypothetical protein